MNIVALILFLSNSLQAAGTALTVNIDGKDQSHKTIIVAGMMFSNNCAKECDAKAAVRGLPRAFPKARHPALNHPAASYCKAIGGKNLIARTTGRGEIDICRFPDKSFIDSWQLFYKHYPKETISK